MTARRVLAIGIVAALAAVAAAPAAAQPPDPVKKLLDLVRKADGFIAGIQEAAKARDIPKLRDLIKQYVDTVRKTDEEAKKLPPNAPGVEHALKTVREATMKHRAALERALAAVTDPQAKAALERAIVIAETGALVATGVLERIEAGNPGPPTVPRDRP